MAQLMSLLPVLAVMIGPLLLMAFIATAISKVRKQRKRRPFTQDFLREPGHSLRQQLESFDEKLNGYIALLMGGPMYFYAAHISQSYFTGREETMFRIAFSSFLAVAIVVYTMVKMLKLLKEMRNTRLGLEGEIAVGQMLEPLLRQGGWVFHDFQAGKFNIDHILVNQAGVFAIETKTRSKSNGEGGTEAVRVVFDGKELKFPNYSESQPIDQARRQAKWLSQWLEGAVGQKLAVQPVVAIPGWFVERTGRSDVIVTNPKKPEFLTKPMNGQPCLNEQLIKQVVFQLDRHCRDFVPGSEEAS